MGVLQKGDKYMAVALDAASLIEAGNPQILDDVLIRICNLMQLSLTQFSLAEQHYHAICDWLGARESALYRYRPDLYPQGSVALGTTVKPQKRDEYDVDLVCELAIDPGSVTRPVLLLDVIETRMRENERYRDRLERKKRCLRVNYEHSFHLDILPACPDAEGGRTCLLIPDRKQQEWQATNPKGFIQWFKGRSALRLASSRTKMAMDSAAPLPQPQSADEKTALQVTVQLVKRWRDLHYAEGSELAPVSIVLTTLLGNHYVGEQSVSTNLLTSVDAIVSATQSSKRLVVTNPSHPDEELSERWKHDDGAYEAFVEGIKMLRGQLQQLVSANGVGERSEIIQVMFGETLARTAFERQAKSIQEFRDSQHMRFAKSAAGVVTLSASAGAVVPRNTFYGDSK
jgi:hypothetical protein